MTLLMYSEVDPSDMCFYPRSGKIFVRGLGIVIRPELVSHRDE